MHRYNFPAGQCITCSLATQGLDTRKTINQKESYVRDQRPRKHYPYGT
jgi:hypothetical protein